LIINQLRFFHLYIFPTFSPHNQKRCKSTIISYSIL